MRSIIGMRPRTMRSCRPNHRFDPAAAFLFKRRFVGLSRDAFQQGVNLFLGEKIL